MRRYARCKTDGRKFFVASKAKTRAELPKSFYLTCPDNHTHTYIPSSIFAEAGFGIMEILFGENRDIQKINNFNNS